METNDSGGISSLTFWNMNVSALQKGGFNWCLRSWLSVREKKRETCVIVKSRAAHLLFILPDWGVLWLQCLLWVPLSVCLTFLSVALCLFQRYGRQESEPVWSEEKWNYLSAACCLRDWPGKWDINLWSLLIITACVCVCFQWVGVKRGESAFCDTPQRKKWFPREEQPPPLTPLPSVFLWQLATTEPENQVQLLWN